ncbi:hypothetical protein SAMN02910456_00351 [Ruminococcaceae bacterium YRB3002]|nr:hypothetical protein SAMN02910456_00351 [Ruminococcaceae bacterium YRB3002]
MRKLNCSNCGAIMTLDASAMTAECRFCGTRYVLNREDTDYYLDFYKQMSKFLAAGKDEHDRMMKTEALWETADEQIFGCADGRQIEIRYLYSASFREADIYVARRNIIYHFKNSGAELSDRFRHVVSFIDYPSADTKNLADFFPKVSGGFELDDGSFILVINKDADEYPLRIFGKLTGRHVAWIISRIENLCCVLEYNGLVHPQIDPDTLFINPYQHTVSLLGNWWAVSRKNAMNDDKVIMKTSMNLTGLRNTARDILGDDNAPAALLEFIASTPKEDAYEDFAYWDDMLIRAYGERKFITFETDDADIYGKKED